MHLQHAHFHAASFILTFNQPIIPGNHDIFGRKKVIAGSQKLHLGAPEPKQSAPHRFYGTLK